MVGNLARTKAIVLADLIKGARKLISPSKLAVRRAAGDNSPRFRES